MTAEAIYRRARQRALRLRRLSRMRGASSRWNAKLADLALHQALTARRDAWRWRDAMAWWEECRRHLPPAPLDAAREWAQRGGR